MGQEVTTQEATMQEVTMRCSTALSPNNPNRIRHASITAPVSARFSPVRVSKRIPLARRKKQIRLHSMLLGVQIKISPTLRVQRFMRPTLDNAPTFNHQNLLRPPNRRKPVRNHKCGAPAHQVAQPFLYQRLGFGIQARGSLIENKDARVGKDRTRDRNPLLLPARKLYAPLADNRLILFLERFREFIHARDAASRHNFLFTSLRPRERHVLANRSIKQKRFLQHDAK